MNIMLWFVYKTKKKTKKTITYCDSWGAAAFNVLFIFYLQKHIKCCGSLKIAAYNYIF